MNGRRLLALLLVAVWHAAFLRGFPAEAARSSPGPIARLLGPAATLLSHVEWIRFTRARIGGENEEALLLAERALELAPESTDGWEHLASFLATYLASPEREPDPERRTAWFDAGIAVTRRGAERAGDPGRLAITRALLYLNKGELDPAGYPGGEAALLEGALEALFEARALGVPGSDSLATEVERALRR